MKSLKSIIALSGLLMAGCTTRAGSELSDAEVGKLLAQGAMVVDVRTVQEFNTQHLTNVVNIPLGEVKEKFPGVVTNKSDVVLLHCRSGRRSGTAEKELRALGYTNVFNIGSYEKAEKLLRESGR